MICTACRTKWIHSGQYRMYDKYDTEADAEVERLREYANSGTRTLFLPSFTSFQLFHRQPYLRGRYAYMDLFLCSSHSIVPREARLLRGLVIAF